jgi:DNA primase
LFRLRQRRQRYKFHYDIENLSYPDAIHFLARRAGMQVPEDRPDESHKRRERMLALNREAAKFFHERLTAPGGNPCSEYVKRRGISPAW